MAHKIDSMATLVVVAVIAAAIGAVLTASLLTAGSRGELSATEHAGTPLADAAAEGGVILPASIAALPQRPADPASTQRLIGRYLAESSLDGRGAILAQLQGSTDAAVLQFAMRLARSGDPQQRQDAQQLLQAFPLDQAPVRDFLVQQLRDQTDPAALKQSLDMLIPASMANEDAAPVVDQLQRLKTHADPAVRAASVLQLSQWDRQGDQEELLYNALLDREAPVREAGMAGISAQRVRSPRIKEVLLATLTDAQASNDERSAAAFILQQDYPLTRAEYAVYRNAMKDVQALGDHDAPGSHSH